MIWTASVDLKIYYGALVINGTETRTKTHSVFGFDIRVKRIIVNEFKVISAVALLCFTFVELEPDNVFIIILATTSNHPGNMYFRGIFIAFKLNLHLDVFMDGTNTG